MNKRHLVAWLELIAASALGVGIVLFMLSSPSSHPISLVPAPAKRTSGIDPTQAKAAFDEQVANYQKAGEPVRAEDMTPPPVEPGNNAATLFVEAIAILDRFDVPANRPFFNLDVQLGMPADKWNLVNDVLAIQLAPLLAKVDEATKRPACVWDIKYTSPILRTLLRHLNGARGVANIVRPAALLAHRAGRDDEAVRRIGQLLQIARWIDQRPFVVSHLVALGASRMAGDTAAEIVPTLKIGDAPGEASEAQIRALISDFLDDAWAREGLRSAMMAERLSIVDAATCLETGKITTAAMAQVMSGKSAPPFSEITPGEAYSDAMPMMKMIDPMIEAARTSQRLGQFQAKLPLPQSPPSSVMSAMMPSLDRAVAKHYTAVGRLRLAATALAARLWMVQHDGQPPATLNELVPSYIAAIPLDPLAPTDGGTFMCTPTPQPRIVGTTVRPQDRMEVLLTAK